MALILDKATTGITSMITITGVTTVFVATGYTERIPTETGYIETTYFEYMYTETTVKTGLTHLVYDDPFGGISTDPYLIINSVIIDRINKIARIDSSIYISKTSREKLTKPVDTICYQITYPILFDTYFSMAELEEVNVFKKAYEYLDVTLEGWKSDE